MRRRTNPPVVLADGFSLSQQLTAPRLVAYKQYRREDRGFQNLSVQRIDSQDSRVVFVDKRITLNCPPAWGPDGKTLYHTHGQIFAIDVETGAIRIVTDFQNGERANWHLSCSPDGQTLAFLDFPPGEPDTNISPPHRLCTICTDGTGFRVILDQPEGYRIWQTDVSWQSRRAVVSGIIPRQGTALWTVDLDGGEPMRVGLVPLRVRDFRLSPDGHQIVYSLDSDEGLYVLSIADGQSRQISRIGTHPSWSPDGRQIAFMYGNHELWTITAEDDNPQMVVGFGGRNYHPKTRPGMSYVHTPLWSPDGRFLWGRLTKTRRLRTARDPDFLQRVKADILAGKRHYGAMTDAQREEAILDAIKREHWDYVFKQSIIDFSQGLVLIHDGYWKDVAWAPLEKGMG